LKGSRGRLARSASSARRAKGRKVCRRAAACYPPRMEVGLHFVAEHELLRRKQQGIRLPYHLVILRKFFQILLADGPPRIRTFIRIGELGLHDLAERVIEDKSPDGLSVKVRYDPKALAKAWDEWIAPEEWLWSHRMEEAYGKRIFVVHLSECSPELIAKLDRGLKAWSPYVGARRVEHRSAVDSLYENRLVRMFFLSGAHIRRLSDGDPDEDPDIALLDFLRELPFASVGSAYIPSKEDEDRLDDILGLA